MRDKIKALLEKQLPLVDLESEYLYEELDSLGVTTILMSLSEEYNIKLDSKDATPRNLKSLDSIVALVEKRLNEGENK